MKRISAFFSVALLVSACDSTNVGVTDASNQNSPNTITIAADPRAALATISATEFNGRYETTAPTELGSGPRGDGGTDSDESTLASGSAESTDSVDSSSSASSVSIPGPGNPVQTIDPGTLTAGDYDDHLNPSQYQHYANEYLQRRGQWIDIPRMDFNNRISVEVTDPSGAPYADARIDVADGAISLLTAANGVTSIYNDLDTLSESFNLRVTGTDGSSVQQMINLQKATEAGKILVTLAKAGQNQSDTAAVPLDLMFVIDSTGSMGDELNFLQTELSDIITSVTQQQSDLKIGLVFYRDYGDDYIVRAHDFTSDLNSVQLDLNQESANGGGDYPEAMDQALQSALSASWRNTSRKILFLVADAPPHSDRMRATWTAAEQARLKNIHIVPVAASGVGEDAEYIMRSAAALTNSRYVFLTDDSGYGLPHAEPEIDCYVVTLLRDALTRTINSLVTGTRIEPSDNDIIRRAGDYNQGVCSPENSSTGTVAHSIIVERNNGGQSDKKIEIITDQSTLNDRLASYGEPSVSLDFSIGKAILVDMGPKNTGDFSTDIASIEEYDNHVLANIVFEHPGLNCAVTLALTHPFSFIIVETKKELRTSDIIVRRECEI